MEAVYSIQFRLLEQMQPNLQNSRRLQPQLIRLCLAYPIWPTLIQTMCANAQMDSTFLQCPLRKVILALGPPYRLQQSRSRSRARRLPLRPDCGYPSSWDESHNN